jgi:hypothetical protein
MALAASLIVRACRVCPPEVLIRKSEAAEMRGIPSQLQHRSGILENRSICAIEQKKRVAFGP